VVVLTETSLAESIRIDDFCHANGIAFIKVGLSGGRSGASRLA
jgi:6-phosphogluconate dehydrogenase